MSDKPRVLVACEESQKELMMSEWLIELMPLIGIFGGPTAVVGVGVLYKILKMQREAQESCSLNALDRANREIRQDLEHFDKPIGGGVGRLIAESSYEPEERGGK